MKGPGVVSGDAGVASGRVYGSVTRCLGNTSARGGGFVKGSLLPFAVVCSETTGARAGPRALGN